MCINTAYSKQHGKIYCRHLLRDSCRENGKIKHRTVANLSRCSETEIAAFKLALKYNDNLAQLVNVKDIGVKQGMRIGASFLPGLVWLRRWVTIEMGGWRCSR